jgi:hypothetical protein
MICSNIEPHPSGPQEWRDTMLGAAIVLRDVSFLRPRNRCVQLGCRVIMREHALQWRKQLFPKDAGSFSPRPNLEMGDALSKAA